MATDDGYMQFVVSLLDELDCQPAKAIKRELEENFGDDFLPSHAEFIVRDRAFSWDLGFEEQLHPDVIEQLNQYRKRSNSKVDIKVSCSDSSESRLLPASFKKMKEEFHDPVATVRLHSGSGATTVMPAFCDSDSFSNGSNRIGAYTKEERQILIEKFRAKKKRRVWRKQIKYDCRKRLADTRPRVKGRFVSRKEKDTLSDGDCESMESLHNIDLDIGVYDDDSCVDHSS